MWVAMRAAAVDLQRVICSFPYFAYVHWREDYELEPFRNAYDQAFNATLGFQRVDVSQLTDTLGSAPEALRVFRLILGFTAQEFAAATRLVSEPIGTKPLSVSTVRSIESGASPCLRFPRFLTC